MTTRKVAVTDYTFDSLDVERTILEPLGCQVVGQKTGKDPQQLADLVKDADYVLTQFAPVNAAVVSAMQKCKVIVRYGIGVDNVDLRAAAAKCIPVCNVPDYCINEVADHALAMILDLTRKITANAAKVKSGGWGSAVPLQALSAVKDLCIGIVGWGRIGREVAGRLKAFKCEILVHDPAVGDSTISAAGFTPVGLDELLRRSDLVTLHCPSNEGNRQMINAQSLARMKACAMLVNTSRGTLVKTGDLIAALQAGTISAAALDVTDPEPPDPDSPLRKMDNVIITSHIASASPKAVLKLRRQAANIVALAARGEKLPNIVNGVTA
ncbi:MAG: C-terminal binding protein [Planctomycetota bacterium]|nr:C-terminal binding protein [Planctomycetota bacterium]